MSFSSSFTNQPLLLESEGEGRGGKEEDRAALVISFTFCSVPSASMETLGIHGLCSPLCVGGVLLKEQVAAITLGKQ